MQIVGNSKETLLNLLLLAFSGIAIFLGLFYGSYQLNGLSNPRSLLIFQDLRLPRVLCSFVIGGTLSCIGLITQSLLRNPLACPYTLGSSQLFALIFFGYIFLSGPSLTALVAVIVLFLSLVTFCILQLGHRFLDLPQHIILLGISIGIFCSSMILGLQFLVDGISLVQMTRWLMGSLSVVGFEWLAFVLPVCLVVIYAGLHFSRELDLLQISEEYALGKGVEVRQIYLLWLGIIFLAVAILVYFVGPIGFVGLLIPHLIRLLGIRKHKQMIPMVFMAGGIFLTLSDLLSRVIISSSELPVGVVTGILGSPLFILLLFRTTAQRRL